MSKIEVDAIDKQSGSTLTLGGSGTAVTLASGATQSGFGRTGTVDWQTGSIKTATFTAANGEGYFCNTAGGTFEVDLPAGSTGAIVSVQDYNNTFDSNALTIDPNGSEKINGGNAGDPIRLTTAGQGLTLVYVDATIGWRSVQDNEFADRGSAFITATGGNAIVTCGNFKTHIFTGPGTFAVSATAIAPACNAMDYLVIAGGGAGAADSAASGGGAGGFRMSNDLCVPAPTTSPLANPTGLTATVSSFPITVGAGGTYTPGPSSQTSASGSNSIFSTITSAGGGGGVNNPNRVGVNGGSGSGAKGAPAFPGPGFSGGSGNTPPVSPPQGNNGGAGWDGIAGNTQGGGGGGAGAVGGNASSGAGGPGGVGSYMGDTFVGPTAPSYGTPGPVGSTRYFAGGGGGATDTPTSSTFPGGDGGGGKGGGPSTPTADRTGDTNTGGAGGAGGTNFGNGGSGIVMIRYKFQ